MELLWPISLVGLAPAVVVALWALMRPGRQEAVVGSLAVWQKALAALDRSAKRSSRRISAGWLLLLAGAVAALLGLSRPVVQTHGQARHVAIALTPSAELGDAGLAQMTAAAEALLARLAPGDRVQLILPECLGGAAPAASPQEARERIARLGLLAAPADKLTMPPAPGDIQRVYRFAPAGLAAPAGPRTTTIAVAENLPAVTIDAIGAAPIGTAAGEPNTPATSPAARSGGTVELYLAVRNQTQRPLAVNIRVETLAADLSAWRPAGRADVQLTAHARSGLIFRVPSAEAVRAVVASDNGTVLDVAQLARVRVARRKVAIVGRDEPVLRRFIRADDALELVASASEADFVFANRADPPAGVPALVIDPPNDPPGWQRGELRRAVTFADANVAADDALLAGVNLSAAAVRRVRPWVALGNSRFTPVVRVGGGAVIVSDVSDAGGGKSAAGTGPGRIYVAFELSSDNTNLGTSESLVVLLANAVSLLSPAGAGQVRYEYLAPLAAPRSADWKRAGPPTAGETARTWSGPLPAPGVYVDDAGGLRAVSLVGLRSGLPATSATSAGSASEPATAPAAVDPIKAVADVPLPQPETIGTRVELWPWLALAAMACWLAGWAMRTR